MNGNFFEKLGRQPRKREHIFLVFQDRCLIIITLLSSAPGLGSLDVIRKQPDEDPILSFHLEG
jgi:hypothetical protein